MKTQIKHRYSGAVLFKCDVPDEVSSGLAMRHALEKAVAAGANLAGANLADADLAGADLADANLADAYLARANLADADLAGAYLAGADLARANLAGADLADANLAGADLARANLAYANLADAYLADAYLAGANLAGAKFADDKLLIGKRPFFTICPIGSRCALLSLWITDKGPYVKAGCFTGTIDEFAAAVKETHGDNEYAQEYAAALVLINKHVELWTPKVEAAA